jgi:hypothetical protein
VLILGRAGNGKRSYVAFCIGLRRIDERYIEILPWLELETAGLAK